MDALTNQFGTSMTLVVAIVIASVFSAGLVARGASGPISSRVIAAVRPLAIGAGIAIVAATALPQVWPPRFAGDGDLVLELGRGGLREWRSILENPASWTAVLLLANVVLYVPFGLLGMLAWPQRKIRVISAGVGISLLVEASHFTISERVASTDDVILNAVGLALGCLLAIVTLKALPDRLDRPVSRLDEHGTATGPAGSSIGSQLTRWSAAGGSQGTSAADVGAPDASEPFESSTR